VHGAGWYTSLINWVRVNSDYTGEEIDVRKIMKAATTMYTNSRRDQREGTKHVFYSSVKQFQPYEPEPYLSLENFYYRQIMAQIRTGTNFLEVDVGRRTVPFTPHAERTCKCCTSGDVEDEQHYIFVCRAYDGIRLKYPDLFLVERNLKTFFLNDNKRTARFLTECRNLRDTMQ
jgi:hypothetical protein